MRRLTSAEYAYTIRDLTGLALRLERGFVSDAVGRYGVYHDLESWRRLAENAGFEPMLAPELPWGCFEERPRR